MMLVITTDVSLLKLSVTYPNAAVPAREPKKNTVWVKAWRQDSSQTQFICKKKSKCGNTPQIFSIKNPTSVEADL